MKVKLKRILNWQNDERDIILHNALVSLLKSLHTDGIRYNVSDTDDMRCLGYRFMKEIMTTSSYNTMSTAYPLMTQHWGIEYSGVLAQLFIDHGPELRKAGYDTSCIIGADGRGRQNTKKNKKSNVVNINVRPVLDINSIKDTTRAVVCRSKSGAYGYRIYELVGPVSAKSSMLTAVKSKFKDDTGCPYYDVRPILFSTWVRLSPEQQVGTTQNAI